MVLRCTQPGAFEALPGASVVGIFLERAGVLDDRSVEVLGQLRLLALMTEPCGGGASAQDDCDDADGEVTLSCADHP
jgi:hypothetical protein